MPETGSPTRIDVLLAAALAVSYLLYLAVLFGVI
jgi:hypothetical protein